MAEIVTVGSITSKVGSGATPRGGSNVYTSDGVAFIRSKNVLDNRMRLDDLVRIDDAAAEALRGVTVHPGDVLLNITGDSIARCCLVDPAVLPARVSQHVAIIRSTERMDPRFLQRALVAPGMKQRLLGMSDGGTRKALTKAMIEALEVPCPPIRRQVAIANVLGALDDKIAANDRQIKLVQELADAVFASFAQDLPDRESTFDDVAEIGGGGTPRTSVDEYWGGSILWATPTDVTALAAPYLRGTGRMITDAGLAACGSSLYPAGSILMTSRATIGAFAVAQVPTAVNQGFIVVNAREPLYQWWLFHEMRSRVSEFLNFANGATFLELPRGRFKALRVRLPGVESARRFDEAVRPLHELAAAVLVENHRLAATRDELLPLMMSGRIRVREADKVVEGVLQ